MKKSDFVEVYVYFPTYKYSGGVVYSKDKLNNGSRKDEQYKLDGKTLLTKEFYEKHNTNDIIDFSWIE